MPIRLWKSMSSMKPLPADQFNGNMAILEQANNDVEDRLSSGDFTIANGSISTDQIADGAITDAKIDRITTNKLTVVSADIANASITNAKLDRATANRIAIVEADIVDASIGTAKIKDAAITNAKIDRASVDKLVVNTADIADAAINNAKIADASISTAKIADAQISTAKIATGAITTALIGTGAVDTAQIKDGSITDAKIVELTANKITSGQLSTERLIIRDTVDPTKSLIYEINNITGALQSVQGETLNGEVLTERSITTDKIVANAITANEIASATITANKMVAGTITAASGIIADAAITNAKIASLDAGKITTGTLDASLITISNMKVGGRNLILNSSNVLRNSSVSQYTGPLSPDVSTVYFDDYNIVAGDVITFRIYLDCTSNTIKGGRARMSYYKPDNSYGAVYGNFIGIGEKGYSTVSWTVLDGYTRVVLFIGSSNTSITTLEVVKYKEAKLEKGRVATDWTPAPEDLGIAGTTIIDGGNITTGKITSTDGNTWFDLDNSIIACEEVYSHPIRGNGVKSSTLENGVLDILVKTPLVTSGMSIGDDMVNFVNMRVDDTNGVQAGYNLLNIAGYFYVDPGTGEITSAHISIGANQDGYAQFFDVPIYFTEMVSFDQPVLSDILMRDKAVKFPNVAGDSAVFIQRGSNNNLKIINPFASNAYIEIGCQNSSYAHIYTDRANFYFNKPILVSGTAVSLSNHTHSYLPLAGGTLTGAITSNANITTTANMYVGSGGSLVLSTGNVRIYTPWMGDNGYNQAITGNVHTNRQGGFYMGSGLTNAPTSDWHYYMVQRHNDNYMVITAWPLNYAGYVWWKRNTNGTWTSWMRINA